MGAEPFSPGTPASCADEPSPVSGATHHVVGMPVLAAHRPEVLCISSESLLAGATEVQIEHRGALYRLRQTSLGKLILTK